MPAARAVVLYVFTCPPDPEVAAGIPAATCGCDGDPTLPLTAVQGTCRPIDARRVRFIAAPFSATCLSAIDLATIDRAGQLLLPFPGRAG